MITPSYAAKHYTSAHRRFLEAAVARFFEVNFPGFFGPDIRTRIADSLLELITAQMPPTSHLRPGQCLWNAVAIDTRADSPHCRFIPVVLTLVADTDITQLAAGVPRARVNQDVIARLMQEAHQQGALLSVRDAGLLLASTDPTISSLRQEWERRNEQILPHPGNLQDMGSCITHKTDIVVKAVYQKKDTRQVARETNHTQQAVDRYLRDFYRVRTSYRHKPDLDFICQVTGMAKHLVKQYLEIIETYETNVLS